MTTFSYAQIQQLWVDGGGNPSVAPIAAAIALAESGGHSDSLNDTPATGDYSVGLWQINYYAGLRAERVAKYGTPEQLLASPLLQARAAVDISGGGTNWRPWSTYLNGAYRQFVGAPAVGQGGGQVTLPPGVEGVPGIGATGTGSAGTVGSGGLGKVIGHAIATITGAAGGAAVAIGGQPGTGGVGDQVAGGVADAVTAPLHAFSSVMDIATGIANWVTNPANMLRIIEVVIGGIGILVGIVIMARKPIEQVGTTAAKAGVLAA